MAAPSEKAEEHAAPHSESGMTEGKTMADATEQPRERLLAHGPQALTDAELLQLIVRRQPALSGPGNCQRGVDHLSSITRLSRR